MSKTVLVTGGTRGIGHAISAAMAKAGYKVAANYAGNDEAAKATADELGIHVYKFDVADYDAVGEGIAAIEKDLGPIDIVVNNAGVTRDAPFHKMTKDQWQQVIDIDLTSAFNVTRQVWDGMRGPYQLVMNGQLSPREGAALMQQEVEKRIADSAL